MIKNYEQYLVTKDRLLMFKQYQKRQQDTYLLEKLSLDALNSVIEELEAEIQEYEKFGVEDAS